MIRKTIALLTLSCMLFFTMCAGVSAEENAVNITKKCVVKVSGGTTKPLADGSEKTVWKPNDGKGEMRVKLPDGARVFELSWAIEPENYSVTEYDKDEKPLAVHETGTDRFPCLRMLYTLAEGTEYVFVRFEQKGQGIARFRVFSEGKLPESVIEWEKGPEKCDLMVFSAHQDDEWLWFGATIPYYQRVRKKNVQLVYMADCGRMRYGEALSANAVAGMTTYPLFLGLKDEKVKNMSKTVSDWGGEDKVLALLVQTIRRYRPEVILTHDWDGEYGHNQHKVTSRLMDKAIEKAADPAQYPESAQEYGAWQVKKLYRHSWKEQVLQFDWHVPYAELGGRTGIQVAKDAMEQNKSQLKNYRVQDGGKYDNSLFGLCFSTVGDDVLHNDLFENIEDAGEPIAQDIPQEELAEEDFAPEEDFTEEELSEEDFAEEELSEEERFDETEDLEEETPAAEEPAREETGRAFPWGVPVVALAGCGAAALWHTTQKRKRRRHRKHLKR